MDIGEQRVGNVWVVTATGRLDGATSGVFAQRVGALTSGADARLIVDLSGIEFLSSAGLRAIMTLFKKIKAAKGAFVLCAVPEPVREVLEITGFSELIQIHDERATALAALS
jgi:anti-anti-sigma factor